jgi:hypothetical protein
MSTCSCGSNSLSIGSSFGAPKVGPRGPQGLQGIQGAQGNPGTNGSNGTNGTNGTNGLNGANGVDGDKYSTTSVSTLTIGTPGSLTVGLNLGYVPAQPIIISNSVTNYMNCTVVTYVKATGVLTFTVNSTVGSGTFSSWNVSLSGIQGPPGLQGIQGIPGTNGTNGINGTNGTNGANGAAGVQGIQGIQGIQGLAGANGTSAFVYAGFWDSTLTNFSTTVAGVVGGAAFMQFITSIVIIPSLSISNFTISPTVNYISDMIPIGTSTPSTPSGNFSSGVINPSGSGTTGDVYLNTATGNFFYYNGSTWILLSYGYVTTAYQNVVPFSPFVVEATNLPKYRQQGQSVITNGSIKNGTSPSYINTNTLLYNYPLGYRPVKKQYSTILDLYSGITSIVSIDTNGDVTLLASKTPCYDGELILDTIDFELT